MSFVVTPWQALVLCLERCRMTLEHHADRFAEDPVAAQIQITDQCCEAIRVLGSLRAEPENARYWEKVRLFKWPPDSVTPGVILYFVTPATADVLKERERQRELWGEQNHDAFRWLAILGEEVGEACQAALHDEFGGSHEGTLRREMVQIAAVAVAFIECLDRNGPNGGKPIHFANCSECGGTGGRYDGDPCSPQGTRWLPCERCGAAAPV